MEDNMEITQISEKDLPYDLTKQNEISTEELLLPSMMIAAQFTRAQVWNQLRCPSLDDWMNKLCYIYTME